MILCIFLHPKIFMEDDVKNTTSSLLRITMCSSHHDTLVSNPSHRDEMKSYRVNLVFQTFFACLSHSKQKFVKLVFYLK